MKKEMTEYPGEYVFKDIFSGVFFDSLRETLFFFQLLQKNCEFLKTI